jgi:hypothetical protein
MVQKAKLDILENLPELEIVDTIILPDVQEDSIPPPREKWAINKLLLIGAPVLIAVLVPGGFLVVLSDKNYLHNYVSAVSREKLISST